MRPCPLVPLLCVAALALCLACESAEERAEAARADARAALERADRPAALAALRELRRVQPDTPEALLELATLLAAAGETLEAVWLLEDGVSRFPTRDELRLGLADAALVVGNASLARRALEPIGPDSEQHPLALVASARAELELGNLERALEILDEAEHLYPERPEARLARIGTLFGEQRYDEAQEAIAAARSALPDDDEQSRAVLRRVEIQLTGIQAARAESPDAAIARLRELLDADREDAFGWHTLVQALARAHRTEEALELLEAGIEEDPDRLALYPWAASLYAALGQEPDAERLLRDLVARSDSPASRLTLARYYTLRGDEKRALAAYDAALAAFPEANELQRFHAEALLGFGRVDEAREAVERYAAAAQKGDPISEYLQARLELAGGSAAEAADRLEKLMPKLDSAATQYWLGRALEELGDREGAARRYGLARSRDWTDPSASLALMALAERRGDWAALAGEARLLLRSSPGLYEAWAALVDGLVQLGEGDEAEPIARRALTLFPKRPEVHTLVARALRAQGRFDESLEALERAPAGPERAAERALTLGIAGRTDEGIEAARAALAGAPDEAVLHASLGALLFQLGQADEGSAEIDRALALDPDEPHPLRVRCEFRAATGRFEGARADCEQYLEARPDDPGAHFMLGVSHAGAGRSEKAAAAYRRAAELDDGAFAPRNNLAELLASQGDLDAALAAAQEAYALAEDNPYVLDTLGSLYRRKGLADRAVSVLEDAYAGLPDVPAVQLNLALAYRDAGRRDDARRLLDDLRPKVAAAPELRARTEEAIHSLQ